MKILIRQKYLNVNRIIILQFHESGYIRNKLY